MSLVRETAFDVLGLPTFATVDDIIHRYKSLALAWFPEGHINPEFATQEFSNISQAALTLLYPNRTTRKLQLAEMYGFFQFVFFGDKEHFVEDESDSESSIPFEVVESILEEEIAAEHNATELIDEEEREKQKAEKRRAKKKKRKEKKREKIAEVNSQKADVSISSNDTKQKSQGAKKYDSEEEIDTASAFVSVIAKKQKKVSDVETKDKAVPSKKSQPISKESNGSTSFVPVLSKKQKKQQSVEAKTKVDCSTQAYAEVLSEDLEESVLQSRQLALRGNELASTGFYNEAIELFNQAIRLDPTDHRFYGNRSYCFDRLGQYERALKDGEKSIALSPVWPKGYFRRGRALLGLKQYALAEQNFIEVLKRDENCDDAICELRKSRLYQIVEKGFSREAAEAALCQHNTVQEALESLLSNGMSKVRVKGDLDGFSEAKPTVKVKAKKKEEKKETPKEPYDIKMDPNNPEGHNSLWIGNVQTDVTEKKLITMFGKFGELINIKVMNEKYCAFVNYKSKNSPGKAMKAYQGYELSGAKLLIRFPNLAGEPLPAKKKAVIVTPSETKVLGPVNGYECYFWRTSGCSNGADCRYQHIKEHKGIDSKKK